MTISHDTSPGDQFDAERLHDLIAATIEGTLGPSEAIELERILTGAPEARRLYRDMMQVDAGIDWHVRGRENVQSFVVATLPGAGCAPAKDPRTELRASAVRKRRVVLGILAIAAGLLIAFGVGLWLRNSGERSGTGFAQHKNRGVQGAGELDVPEKQEVVAKLVDLTGDCRWFVESRLQDRDRSVRGGDTIRLTQGRLRVDFECGATVTLRAPAALQTISAKQARAVLGTLTAHAGPGAEGFTIDTPRTRVVDLGTDFGIDVSQHGSTDVVVFNGAVDLHYDDADGARSSQRLQMGEAARVSGEGTASRIVSIVDSQFSAEDDLLEGGEPPLISAVEDNIRRGGSWRYYEIVRGGMREDAKAFVDRKNHEWNGMTEAGMPAYLVGGDYVKTFNDDKWNTEVTIRVTLERPAMLYVLHDDRLPVPDWMREEFTDTGDDIGMDGGGYTRDERVRTIDKGAGVSIDDVFSIWQREVPMAGTVQMGALIIGGQKNNMYGIVAVPLDANGVVTPVR